MSLATVNVLNVALDGQLDEAGFRHAATAIGARLRAARIGAGVYEARAGVPIWPYHYHHGVEEWLYVIAGAPVLREPAGERVLAPGDLVCFPSGPLGAHTLSGPGRFVIFATGQHVEPYMSVYPDSGKVSGPEGILLRSSEVGYWHGEGTAGAVGPEPAPAAGARSAPSAPRPIVNVGAPAVGPLAPGPRGEAADAAAAGVTAAGATAAGATAEVGPRLGAERLDGTLIDLDPGERSEPYHYLYGQEAWLLVLSGTPTLRHPGGDDRLEPGDIVCLPDGPAGARRLSNAGASAAHVLLLSTTGLPATVHYPDTGEWRLRNAPGQDEVVIAASDTSSARA